MYNWRHLVHGLDAFHLNQNESKYNGYQVTIHLPRIYIKNFIILLQYFMKASYIYSVRSMSERSAENSITRGN